MPTYFPKRIEPKWQSYWLEHKVFRATEDTSKPKYYILDMFPYPSGDGLHVGHPVGWTATDILARYKRMRGFNVLHPMGWDAFGLPAEQYAVETGAHPRATTTKNIDNFRRQIRMLGFSYDWDREVDTTDPKYYRWTQWIFLRMYGSWYDDAARKARPIAELPIPDAVAKLGEDAVRDYRDAHRLAYVTEAPVNWCPALGTVLANEEVVNGRSERGDHPVVRMPLRQWMLRITAYADRLLDDLDGLDWPDPIKDMQRHWIGRSEGAEVDFPCVRPEDQLADIESWFEGRQGSGFPATPEDHVIRVYTTRPDTLFGATYMVLAPEHPLVDALTTPEQRSAVDEYREQAGRKSDLDRTDLAKEKTGVFTGAYAINPVNREPIPVWIADYVLIGYGTGAIMAVPAHDERDLEFAKKFGLDIVEVVADPEATPKILLLIHRWLGDWERSQPREVDSKYLKVALLLNCGFDSENFEQDLEENRHDPLWAEVETYFDEEQAKGLAVRFLEDDFADILVQYVDEAEDTEILLFSLEPSEEEEEEEDDAEGSLDDEESFEEDFGEDFEDETPEEAYAKPGISIDSGPITGLPTAEAKPMITAWLTEHGLGAKAVNHKLRDWLFSRQRYWGEPFPILLDEQGAHRPLAEDELPLELPELADYKPTGTAEPPLAKASDWLAVERDGKQYRRETNTMPQWAGSCWYYLRYLDPHNDGAGWDPEKERHWMPVDLYVGGAEHAVLHLLYTRFWHKFLFDLGRVSTDEPFRRLVNQGMILGETEYSGYRVGESWVGADAIRDGSVAGQKVRTADGEAVEAVRLTEDEVIKDGNDWVLAADKTVRVDARAFKMSKSRKNVINPDEVVDEYGADSLRLYEMFMGPLEATKPWNTKGVDGVWRFLNRVWRLIVDDRADAMTLAAGITDAEPDRAQRRMLHRTIGGVTEDLEALRFNTAISKLMEFVNFLSKSPSRPRSLVEPLCLLLAPFACHLAEELWQALGHESTITYEPWPRYDETQCVEEEIEVALQLNNKVRSKMTVAADLSDEALIAAARDDGRIRELTADKTVLKSFVVSSRKGKLVNFVVKGG